MQYGILLGLIIFWGILVFHLYYNAFKIVSYKLLLGVYRFLLYMKIPGSKYKCSLNCYKSVT